MKRLGDKLRKNPARRITDVYERPDLSTLVKNDNVLIVVTGDLTFAKHIGQIKTV